MAKRKLFWILMLLFCVAGAWAEGRLQQIRVGIFQVEPLNYMDENGKAQGVNPDLLREIALQRGRWRPEFEPVTWAEGLEKLENEELDLMVSVTYTPERSEFLDFSETSVLDVWSQVFVLPGSDVESVLDLHGFRVGVMREGIHGKNFIDLAEAFGIDYEVTEYDSHQEVFEALESGEVKAGIVPNHFGLRYSGEYNLVKTAIQFAPAPIHFATKKGFNGDVLSDIDAVLSEWKADNNSYYYWRIDHWFGAEGRWERAVPIWLKVLFGVAIITSLLFLFLSWWFRREVLLRTEKLSASEERYRLIVENQTDLIVKVYPDGKFLYVSPTYCDVFGKTESELLGHTFLPLVHEEDQLTTEIEFNKIFEPPHEAYMEQRALTRAGWRWFSWQNSAILDEAGEVKEIIGIGRDITERKNAEDVYKKTTERLRLAVRVGQVGVWEYDFNQDNLIWDQQMFSLYDVEESTFDGTFQAWRDTLLPEDLESAEMQFRKAVQEGISLETEFRIVGRNKQIKYIRTLAEIERDGEGHPVRAVGMNWDVTRRRKMVAALTSSEQDYRKLFENMITGFVLLEEVNNASGLPIDFRITELNAAAVAMMKQSREKLIGRTLNEVFPTLEGYWNDVLSKVAMTGTASAYENRMEELGLVLSTWVFTQKPGHLGVVVSDNTARRVAEDAVLRAQQQLQHIVDNTLDVIFQLDNRGNYTFANSAIKQVTGYDEHEILGMNVYEIVKPEFHERVKNRFKMRADGEQLFESFRFEIVRKDGISRWLELVSRGYWDAAGNLESVHGVARDVSDRVEMEERLEESRGFLSTILDMIPVGVFWKDLDLNYLGGNRTFLNRIGHTSVDKIIGRDDFLVNHAAGQAEQFRGYDREVIKSEESKINYEQEVIFSNGDVRTLLTSKMPLHNLDGEVVGILGAYVDVTERKAAEQELEESRHFLRRIIDTIPARVFWKDLNCVYLGCNVAFAQDAGVQLPDDLVGKTDFDLSWAQTEAEKYRRDDQEVMESGDTLNNFEEQQTHEDGQSYWLSTSKVPILDRSGSVIGVLGAYQDITSRKVLEEERTRLSVAINQSAEAIVIMDLDGFIQYINPAFETVTGFGPEEAIGANLSILKSNRHDDQFYAEIWRTIRSGNSWNGRIVNQYKDGRFYTAESAISPVKDTDDTITNFVVAIRDVSQQVELESHVRQAQKMDAVGRLAGGVAHDFNNILQSILGFSGILMSEMEKGTSQYEDVSEIRKAARRAGDLTRQLLTLSRKHNVEYAVQDLNLIIRQNEKMMGRLIGERIKFIFELDVDLKPVRADLSQIEQIILNLFINARDAMPQGGNLLVKTYNVSAEEGNNGAVGAGSGQICLEVSDTGCGIRDDVRQHLFEPFFTTKQVGEGTGLGLSVVYGIVQQHGGHIDVTSKIGEGAVFKVYLPACDFRELTVPVAGPGKEPLPSLGGHGESVLVVEDDTVLRGLTNRMLKDAGYTVTAVSNVKEAADAIKGGAFHLLLVDMVLPDGSGLDLVRSARSAGGDFAVLLCSGYPQGQDVHESMNINGFRYMEKPIGSMQLLQSVREMLDEKRTV